MNSSILRRNQLSNILTYSILIFGAALCIFPLLLSISFSLMNLTEVSSRAWLPASPQWSNYLNAWEDGKFGIYFWNSVRLATITVAGQLVFTILAGYAFARMKFPGKNFLFGLMLATLILPEAITWVPNFITVSWLGKVGSIQWIDNWPSLTIPFMASAFGIFLMRQFYMQIPNELWDAAQIDGAGHVRFLFTVVIPLTKAPIFIIALLGFNGAWNALAWPLLVSRSDDWRPISHGLNSFIQEAGSELHLQMAGAIISMIPILILYFFTQRQFIEAMTRSGLKG
ncbi:MAG: carbohydrate ABC transporter permease [Chloroflexota bacterium]